jgi:divalent metal cation (Fe/Co/Zn/Cd) transporter
VIGNAGVLLTSGLIAWTGWWWLDLAFGATLGALFLHTGLSVIRSAMPLVRLPGGSTS